MERKLATIREIQEILPIENADAIVLAKIDGWQCVVKKGEFKPGDLCVYMEVDSVLPERPEFEFLRPRGFRIRTIKLKGQISQGIAFPLSIVGNKMSEIFENDISDTGQLSLANKQLVLKVDHKQGDDLTEFLGVVKYDPPVPAQLAGIVKGNFPSFIQKTDEERIQNIPWVLEQHYNDIFYITEKLDGTSSTIYFRDGEFGVCSRNLDLKETADNTLWKIARQLDIENKLKLFGRNIALQGEVIGEGIQKNKYKIKGQTIKFFSVFDIDKYEYVPFHELVNILGKLELDMVPIIDSARSFGKNYTISELLTYAEGKSVLNSCQEREGIVIRSINSDKNSSISTGILSFKAISNKFLLKDED